MKKTILFITSIFILTSCGIEKLETAGNVIASTFKSKSVKVGRSFYTDTQKGEVKSITISLEDVEVIEKDNYPIVKVASVSAKLLIDNLKPEEIGDAEKVVVTITSKAKKNEFKYNVSDLKIIDKYLNVLKSYLTDIKNKNYDNLINYIDTTRMSKADNLSMIHSYKQNDSIMGQQDNITITGFDFTTIKAETELPVVEAWADMSTKENFNRYHLYFNNDGKEIKVLAVGIND